MEIKWVLLYTKSRFGELKRIQWTCLIKDTDLMPTWRAVFPTSLQENLKHCVMRGEEEKSSSESGGVGYDVDPPSTRGVTWGPGLSVCKRGIINTSWAVDVRECETMDIKLGVQRLEHSRHSTPSHFPFHFRKRCFYLKVSFSQEKRI